MSPAGRQAALGIVALLALQFLWHGLLLPPGAGSRSVVVLLFSLPLLPSVLLLVGRRPSAVFWGGVASLLYFSHGITEAWTVAHARPVALAQIALSIWVIVMGSWDGMKARFSKRSKPPTNV
jgi:uncharacterized membrane protein